MSPFFTYMIHTFICSKNEARNYCALESCPLNKSETKAVIIIDYVLFILSVKYFAPNLKMLLISTCYCLAVRLFRRFLINTKLNFWLTISEIM